MAAGLLARQADISDYAAYAPTRHKDAHTFLPRLVELIEKDLVILYVAQLPGMLPVLFERPIWGRRYHQMGGVVVKPGKLPRVTNMKFVGSRVVRGGPWDIAQGSISFAIPLKCCRRIVASGKVVEPKMARCAGLVHWLCLRVT